MIKNKIIKLTIRFSVLNVFTLSFNEKQNRNILFNIYTFNGAIFVGLQLFNKEMKN